MGEIETVTGIISNVKNLSSTSGTMRTNVGGSTQGSVSTKHWITFRVNNRPIRFGGLPEISEGDTITVVGEGSGELTAYALRNDSTNIIYPAPTVPYYLLVGLGVIGSIPGLFGIPDMLAILWVVVLLGFAGYFYSKVQIMNKCNRMLKT